MIWMHCVECKPVSMQIMMKRSDENDDLHVNEWSIQTMMNHTEWSEIIKVTYASGKWYFWETCTRTRRGQMGATICIPSPQRVQRLSTFWGSTGTLCLPDDACYDACDWTNEWHAAAMHSMNIDCLFFCDVKVSMFVLKNKMESPWAPYEIDVELCSECYVFHNALPCSSAGRLKEAMD